MTSRTQSKLAVFLAAAACALAGCARPTSDRITLALNWYPEVEHGGYYAAQVHGYFREEGLDVEILPGGPDAPVLARVASGAVTYGVENADNVLFARAEGVPVVALMAPIQTSPRCIMVHASSGITNLAGLRNLTLAMSPRGAFSHYLRRHVPLDGVRVVPYSGTVSQFLLNTNYAQQGYVFSEPLVARRKGGDPRALLLADIGFNPYTSVLVMREGGDAAQPDRTARFVRACLRGWRRYRADPEPTHRLIHSLNPEMDRASLALGAAALQPLLGDTPIGSMSASRWTELRDQLVDLQLIQPDAVRIEDTFTTKYLWE